MRPIYSFALIPMIACITPPDQPPELEPIDLTCVHCGPNGASVDGEPFSWLRLDHDINDDGVTYLGFRKGNSTYTLDIDRNVLRFLGGDGKWHGYKELVGGVIQISIAKTKKTYDVIIEDVKNCFPQYSQPSPPNSIDCMDHGIPYWTTPASGEAETYILKWKPVGVAPPPGRTTVEATPVCPPVPVEVTGGHLYEAVVFEGDHYDPISRNITSTTMEDKVAPFNIACIGSLPAKQELARRTEATKTGNYDTNIKDDRQALARVWAAQYCGRNVFTETGHRLRVSDRKKWLHQEGWGWEDNKPTSDPYFRYEAVWDATGAVCLDTPRLAVSDPNVPIDPEVFANIRRLCGDIPKCTGQSWFPGNWTKYGQFLTATVARIAIEDQRP